MLVYEIVYEVLFILSALGLITGLIDPPSVIKWGGKKSRKHVLLYYGLAAVVFLLLISVVVSIRTDQKKMILLETGDAVQQNQEGK